MRILFFLLQKEFRQIFRDKAILRMIFIMPCIQLIVLPLAADYEVRNVRFAIVDHDHSEATTQLANKIAASRYFIFEGYYNTYNEALKDVEFDRADVILEFPSHFERTLLKENTANVYIAANAINGVRGNLGAAYVLSILKDYNRDLILRYVPLPKWSDTPQITVTASNWYNPHMNYKIFMVPGILVLLLTMIGTFLTALNIVREKELGTIEQINVTPIHKSQFILGKLIPFWIMGMVVLTFGLLIARLAYGVIPAGNVGLLYLFAAVYLPCVMGMGLLISTRAQTQQQAMLISFFLATVFILLSGLYTPIDSMPQWAQYVTYLNPVRYFIEVIRMVVLKGSTFRDIRFNLFIIFVFSVVMNIWAVLSYRKRV